MVDEKEKVLSSLSERRKINRYDIDPEKEISIPDFKGSLSGVPDAVDALLRNSRLQ